MTTPQRTAQATPALLDILETCGRQSGPVRQPRRDRSPLLAALKLAGTQHVYADTADCEELEKTIVAGEDALFDEVDGNTVNQPLARKVVDRYVADERFSACRARLREAGALRDAGAVVPHLYGTLCGWIGRDMTARFAAGRSWEVSLQLHMGLAGDPDAARAQGRALRRMVPSCFVKVPFTPHAPHCLLVARDLAREGIPVNFTSTFSARQVVVAALLGGVARTNIFMGRLNQGLQAGLLGEHVDLEAQRALRRLRQEAGVETQLIVASLREWQTFVRVAGCDVFTAPCEALEQFLAQTEVPPGAVTSRLETSYEDRLGIDPAVEQRLGSDRIARLYRVEPELIEFLRRLRSSAEFDAMRDGEALQRRFDDAGFGDVFHAPSSGEWDQIRRDKLPDLDAALTARLPLDTHFTLLAHADFEKNQEAIDAALERALAAPR